MLEIDRLQINSSYPGVFNSAQDNNYIYLCASGDAGVTHRVRKSDFSYQGNIYLSGNHIDSYGIDLIETNNSKLYFGQLNRYVNYGLIARIDVPSFVFDGNIQFNNNEDLTQCHNNPIMDKTNRKIYSLGGPLGGETDRLVKFDLASMTREGALFYDAGLYPGLYAGIFDSSRNCMYYGGISNIVKITITPFGINNSVVHPNYTIVSAAIA
jgi:hypothetical protein